MAPQPEPSVPEAVSTALAPWRVDLKLPCVFYNEEFIPVAEASQLFEELRGTLPWKTNSSINRMTALHGEIEGDAAADESQYHYKDAPSLKLEAWTEPLSRVKALVESWYTEKTGVAVKFNVCLANYYIDGSNRIGWHTDREEIGRTTPIASVSLGAPRKFLVRGSSDRQDSADIVLANGSLTIMENLCQHKYVVHCSCTPPSSRFPLFAPSTNTVFYPPPLLLQVRPLHSERQGRHGGPHQPHLPLQERGDGRRADARQQCG
jgi:alkylated DNA repair dioxygenase AlkB